ncbi:MULTISPECIES: MarR family winged helix-turn-helix transcriptional regulator [Aerococcus]|uniref:MarR family winged helix-turn-helix transcriptional regulator n=1 Tax=Aerococcus TaxID=1375 RepID=UPI000DCBC56C|nr:MULTISPECIES: MarR family transcriptional regulator [Aerococcus]MDK6688725.1 MarR family transcriptional regulator [Aerococcus urinae]MDK8133180.1 MarR family transcriptional regulator [Aerococcus urinae]MDK8485294.1 MarR family transcriptional regulator [Aerococcus urinae]MDL5177808.1 MarR family transcriptional regulator [Aerococcus tenax]RAV91829.1 MarR family transcriptional regulator [Aerococcus tenax]
MDLKTSLMELQCELVAERNQANPKEISWLQYDILHQIEQKGELLPSDLSVILGVSRTKLSKALKGLKSMRYIEQTPNEEDGRELYTTLTSDGKDLLHHISNSHSSLHQAAIKTFNKEEQECFIYLSNKLSEELKKARIEQNG